MVAKLLKLLQTTVEQCGELSSDPFPSWTNKSAMGRQRLIQFSRFKLVFIFISVIGIYVEFLSGKFAGRISSG